MNIKETIKLFIPDKGSTPLLEKVLSASLIFFSITSVFYLNQHFPANYGLSGPLIIASIGASAILVFAVPHGKLSQPWSVIGGHLIAAIVGITCVIYIPNIIIAASLSVALSAFFMYLLRCLHPPGGGTALAVIFVPNIQEIGYQFVFNPVLTNSILLVFGGLVLNNILPKRYYPYSLYKPKFKQIPTNADFKNTTVSEADISVALKKMGIYVDITKTELHHIYNLASLTAQQKKLGDIRCKDIMSQHVISAEYADDVEGVWALLAKHKIRAIPIVDTLNCVIGILTIADFLNQLDLNKKSSLIVKLQKFIKKTVGNETDKPEYAGHLMTKDIITLNQEQHVLEALDLVSNTNIRHFPVVDDNDKLVGMITSRNLFLALRGDVYHR